MSTPHRATPDQWRIINGYGAGSWISSTILELRARIEALVSEVESLSAANLSFNSEIEARIEALEAGATCPHIVSSDEGTSYCRLAEQNAPTTEDFLMGAPNALRAVRNFGREIGAAQIARSAMYPLTTTTARIDACNPLKGRRSRAAKLLGITEPSDQPISYEKLLDALGFDDAIWCCRAQPDLSPAWRRYAVWCARQVQHLMTDRRSLDALDVAERHAAGDATDEELTTAEDAAEAAAISGAFEPDATWSAAT
jgi:hypothetical protein